MSEVTATWVPDWTQEVLCQLVLQHVDVKQRLSTCALVCRSWQHAARAVTTDMPVRISRVVQESLSHWLNSSGTGLKQLSVSNSIDDYIPGGTSHIRLDLDFHNLSKLHSFAAACVDFSPHCPGVTDGMSNNTKLSSRQAVAVADNSLGALTALTRLQLSQCETDVRQLHKCTMLRHLQLDWVRQSWLAHEDMEDKEKFALDKIFRIALSNALQQLVQLTHLRLKLNFSVTERGLPYSIHFSRLKHLQHLVLEVFFPLPPDVLSQICLTTLTRLELKVMPCIWEKGEETALLAVLSNLRQLQHLDLHSTLRSQPEDPAAYTALTAAAAAAQLTYLGLEDCFLADGAWKHIFPLGKQLLQLQSLVITDYILSQAGAIQRLASCCPHLRQLQIASRTCSHVLPSGPCGLLVLSQLTGLTALTLKNFEIPDQAADEIADLTQLESLEMGSVCGMSGYAVSSLISLTNLQQLRVVSEDFDDCPVVVWTDNELVELEDSYMENGSSDPMRHRYILHNQAPPGCEHDVSRQLEELCKRFERKWTASPTSDEGWETSSDVTTSSE